MQLDVGVVIPVFNGARYLGAAIESVLAQTLAPRTVVVVDDGSSDGSADIAGQFGSKIVYLRQERAGAAAARNAGQRLIQTAVLAFLDADDLWHKQKLEWQVPLLVGAERPSMVFGHTEQFISPDLAPQDRAQLQCTNGAIPGYCCSSMLLSNASFSATGGFDPALKLGEFIAWFARAQLSGIEPLMATQTVFFRRIHMSNMGRSLDHPRAGFARAMKAVLDMKRANS